MANLVIVASGLATRLTPIHQNLYPKILVNYGQHLLIEKIIKAYDNLQLDSINIIVPDMLAERQIREAFIEVKRSQWDELNFINFVHHEEANGTALTLMQSMLENKIPSENVLVTWSDIFPIDFELSDLSKNAIFIDKNNVHRMEYNKATGCIFPEDEAKGNIPGIFYFKDLKQVFDEYYKYFDNIAENSDITKVLQFLLAERLFKFDNIIEGEIVDTGDLPKYEQCLNELNIESRYFNELTFTDDSVIKKALTTHGLDVIQNESAFYQHIDEIDINRNLINIPKLLDVSENSLTIEKINGPTVHQFLSQFDDRLSQIDRKKLLYFEFNKSIEGLHNQVIPTKMPTTDVITSTYREYYGVTVERLLKIQRILPEINFVNGIQVQSQKEILKVIHEKTEDFVARLDNDQFRLIHGDPNSSNVMIENGEMKFIDPRGRFGETKLYGDPYYDHAKFLYGLTGYDKFNLTKDFRIEYDHKTKSLNVPDIASIELELDELTTSDDLKFIVGLIWLKLPYYTINNINKAIAAYGIGLRLITKYYK